MAFAAGTSSSSVYPSYKLLPVPSFHSNVGPYRCAIKIRQPLHAGFVPLSASFNGSDRFSIAPYTVKRPSRARISVTKFATLDEILLHKSAVESDAKVKMDKALDVMGSNFNSLRAGRAIPSMVERIEVEYHGTSVKLKDISQISTPDPLSLLIQPYDKSSIKSIEKAIMKHGMDLRPVHDGEGIRLYAPQPTSDQRKDLLKVVSELSEQGKVAVRNARRDAMKSFQKLEKEKKLSKDNARDLSNDLQELTDAYVKKINAMVAQKERDLLKI